MFLPSRVFADYYGASFAYYNKKSALPGDPRRRRLPLTVASFRTWQDWAAPARMVPGRTSTGYFYSIQIASFFHN